ncbi:hypothetical protein [Streptomyces sp. SID3343]|uniref:hypothetical protein n=1 Tax=Streptomyces sp. SID3343 TaxID=2690260 RepID=UPI00136FA397|nr:hypothetical protein [Streptomyces sp. SID3343]
MQDGQVVRIVQVRFGAVPSVRILRGRAQAGGGHEAITVPFEVCVEMYQGTHQKM